MRTAGVYAAIQQPAPLQQEGNITTNWREWKMAFEYFLIASDKDAVTSKEKCALFMHIIGKHGREIYEELDITEAEKSNYEVLCKKFNDYCDPQKNINYERHIFFETYQNDLAFDKFLGVLKIKSKSCGFDSLKNSLILTQLIRGLRDVQMREKLLAKSSLGLEEAVIWCRAAERAGQQAAGCSAQHSTSSAGAVERLWRDGARMAVGAPAPRGRWRGGGRGGMARRAPPQQAARQYYSNNVCSKCELRHSESARCPASGVACYRCDRVGHFAKCCRVRPVQSHARELLGDDGGDDDDGVSGDGCGELILYNINIDASDCTESWTETISVDGVYVDFKLDSGADATVMSLRSYEKAGFDRKNLLKCHTILREISKQRLPVVGYFNASLVCNNAKTVQKIYVLQVNCNNLLGLRACINLKLIARTSTSNDIGLKINKIEIDQSVFVGVGCLPTVCKIEIDKSVSPVVNSSRKIPLKLRPRLKEELDNMVKLGVIAREDGPTDWVSNIVVVEKSHNRLRICLDPRHLNKAVKRSHFLLPTLDEIVSNLAGAKFFSKCDAKNGFWMLRLDEESSKLCTFSTPEGRFRFLRMPFGINCAPEIFHNEMHKIFKMEGVEVYCDDLLIWGKTEKEHDDRLKEVMRRALLNGIKFNKNKCMFKASEITFLGHSFNARGMKPENNRVKAIVDLPKPAEKKELERFLGVTNYLSRFIPNYSNISAPLRNLLGKNVNFEWLNIHDKAFNELKSKISSSPVLRYYSPHEPVCVSVDASARGLGACLMQDGRPVAYAARTLVPAETRWAQIEKELLAVVFGCTRFHQYIYGHDVITVESDHKPLEAIMKKPLNETPARLQRMLLKLQHYNIDLRYKPGKEMFIADTLSRAPSEAGSYSDVSQDVVVHVNMLYDNVEATPEMLSKIKEDTTRDPVLLAVCEYYHNGWPHNKRQVKDLVKPYWDVHEELHEVKGILFRNERIVIPASLRKEMVRRVHEGHLGVDKCQRRARGVMWWPGMARDVERAVLACETCQRHRVAPAREPLQPHAVPELPWEVLAGDIFEFRGKQYLLVVDYFSKFVEISHLGNLQSSTVIESLKQMFSRHGIPKKIITDNGTQFTSSEFKTFCKMWEFIHVTSSPMYPRSNGLAERNVRTVKGLMLKAYETSEDWYLALLNFRNSPVTGEIYSPAQLLMSRNLNTRLPATEETLKPHTIDRRIFKDDRSARIDKYKLNYDRGTKTLSKLKPNDTVRLKQNKVWVKSRIVDHAQDGRSYWLRTEDGGLYRRNRQHILKVPNQTQEQNYQPAANSTRRYLDWEQFQGTAHPEPDGAVARPDVQPSASNKEYVTRSGRVVRPPLRY